MAEKPKKVENLPKVVRQHALDGTYNYTRHAEERMLQRSIVDSEVKQVLEFARWEKSKDTYDEENECWKNLVRGETVDGRNLRLIVVEYEPDLLIITTIDLDAEN
jgi:hypothetical protein